MSSIYGTSFAGVNPSVKVLIMQRNFFKTLSIQMAWSYTGLVVLWFVLHSWLGDKLWWLALLNVYAPYLFLPLVVTIPVSLIPWGHFLRISIVPPMLIFLLIYGVLFIPSLPVSVAGDEAPLTIRSFNIWGGSQSVETVQVILDKGTPDIVALQELTPQMAQLLVEKVDNIYPYRVLKPANQAGGMGILSRYPLTRLETTELPDSNWLVQVVQVDTNDRTFTFYNVHLEVTNVLYYIEMDAPVAESVRTSFQSREQQTRWLAADIAARQGPVIVAGDFNTTDQSDAYAILTSQLTDAHYAAGWGFGHTFPAYAGSFRGVPIIPRQMRLDMIFYSEEFAALDSQVGHVYGESDHLPVLARLAWYR